MSKFTLMIAPMTMALLIAGCDHKAADMEPAAQSSAADMASDAATTIANAAAEVKEAVTPTPTGQEFADKAAKSDAFEIASARLALADAASADVKHFAAMMIRDHTMSTARIKAAAMAADPAITPNPDLTDEQNKHLADLGKLSGADFDREYVHQQIAAHETALSLLTLYADHGTVPSLKDAAGAIKPKVQMHLDAIKQIKAKMS